MSLMSFSVPTPRILLQCQLPSKPVNQGVGDGGLKCSEHFSKSSLSLWVVLFLLMTAMTMSLLITPSVNKSNVLLLKLGLELCTDLPLLKWGSSVHAPLLPTLSIFLGWSLPCLCCAPSRQWLPVSPAALSDRRWFLAYWTLVHSGILFCAPDSLTPSAQQSGFNGFPLSQAVLQLWQHARDF